jgi:hypothetical protein
MKLKYFLFYISYNINAAAKQLQHVTQSHEKHVGRFAACKPFNLKYHVKMIRDMDMVL